MDWCQEHLAPRIYKVGDLPSLGSVGIKTVPDEHKGTLRKMLTSVLCKDVSAGEIDDFVDNRTTTWNKKRIGKWHFDDAMLKRVQGGGLGFDFDSKTKPFPIKAWQHVQNLVIEAASSSALFREEQPSNTENISMPHFLLLCTSRWYIVAICQTSPSTKYAEE